MNRKIITLALFIMCGVLATSLFSIQRIRLEKPRQKIKSLQNIGVINNGLPFRTQGAQYAPDQVLVKFKPHVSDRQRTMTLSSVGARTMRRIPHIDLFQVKIPDTLTVDEMLLLLKQNPDVELARPNYKTYVCVTPNDTLFSYQYALHNTGQSIGIPGSPTGLPRADIRAPEAWEETKGSADIIIAVIDSGLDFDHPDLKNKFISRGRDLVNDDFDATDDLGHGTFTSGIAAAETNNDEGIAGAAWNCMILPVKAIDVDGSGYYSWMIDGIIWAADQGAQVISMSIGGDVPDASLEEALKYAYDKGVVITASAGNDTQTVVYPAAYDEYVLAVAATDYNDNWMTWSNTGPEVDVAAPGERIISCVPTWYFGPGSLPYGFGFGTSSAAPYVAGMAALLKAAKPWLEPGQIMDVIRFTADDINSGDYPGRDDFIGYGRINLEKALSPIKIK